MFLLDYIFIMAKYQQIIINDIFNYLTYMY